jgi:CRP-like cAMP-binding protein
LLEDNFEQQRGVIENISANLRVLMADVGPGGGFPEPAKDAYESGKDMRPLNPIERLLALRSVPAFEKASVQTIALLVEAVEDLLVPEGDLALRPGGKNGVLLIVARGVVELERVAPPMTARFGPRSIAGGIASLQEDLRGAKFRAVTPALLLRLRVEHMIDVMEDHFDLTRSLLRHASLERERLMILKLKLSKR